LFVAAMQSRFDVRPARTVARIIRQHGYDLVHTHAPRSALVGRAAAALAGVPVVHHVHSPTANDSTHKWGNRINALVERVSLAHISGVIAVSAAMGRYARRLGIPARNVHVVHNGVPTQGPLTCRRPPDATWTLGTVALFRPRKGLEVLIQAIAVLRDLDRPVRLRAVGGFETPAYEAEIHAIVDRYGVADLIDWVGFVQDVGAELAQMDLFVLPSLFGEGLPMVILEAMAAGVPVVATRIEGVPEAIRDGQDGVLCKPANAHDLAMGVERFLSGDVDWSTVRASAHGRQAAKFSDRSMAAGVAAVYRQVLGP
jgi:glycosyltransferase involved in cell wall biosynthesis